MIDCVIAECLIQVFIYRIIESLSDLLICTIIPMCHSSAW